MKIENTLGSPPNIRSDQQPLLDAFTSGRIIKQITYHSVTSSGKTKYVTRYNFYAHRYIANYSTTGGVRRDLVQGLPPTKKHPKRTQFCMDEVSSFQI